MNYNIHILIIWASATEKKKEIINDINDSFKIINTFNIEWEKEKFLENYIVFYAHSQKHLNKDQLLSLLLGKISHCGNDEFTAVVFKDPSPNMEKRMTSSGPRIVNTNVFDRKCKYREWLGGGHQIHASDDDWETNKDLTLLFGLNTIDFLNKYSKATKEPIIHKKNCIGVDGYESIQQLFYVLNNTIDYCVLRNHECLPDEYTIEGHGDIDLLVENKNYIQYLTLAKQIFPESYRVYHTINISGQEVPFDFRYIGDNYYDLLWQKNILKNKKLSKSLFYTPNDEDQYYSLLYHAYIQKNEVREDYIPKLTLYGKKIGIEFNPNIKNTIRQLDSYMQSKSYEYIKPQDITVIYNLENLKESTYAYRFGKLIKRSREEGTNGYTYDSLVYEKENSYIKRGTNWLLENECRFLTQLQSHVYFPSTISADINEELSIIEISKIKGQEFLSFFANVNHQRKSYLRSFIKEAIHILEILYNNNICHRDFLPGNLIIASQNKKCQVHLIDFGWAIDFNATNIKCPKDLGGIYASTKGYSDLYTFGSILLEYWYDIPYIRRIGYILRSEDALKTQNYPTIFKKVKRYINYPFTPYDELRLFFRRHQRVHMLKEKIKHLL